MINEHNEIGKWEIVNSELNDGVYLITVEATSCEPDFEEVLHAQMHTDKVTHSHLNSVQLELFEFDHNPTTAEIQSALDGRGYNPVIPR